MTCLDCVFAAPLPGLGPWRVWFHVHAFSTVPLPSASQGPLQCRARTPSPPWCGTPHFCPGSGEVLSHQLLRGWGVGRQERRLLAWRCDCPGPSPTGPWRPTLVSTALTSSLFHLQPRCFQLATVSNAAALPGTQGRHYRSRFTE